MVTYANNELQQLYLLQKALQKKDTAQAEQLRRQTGVNDDYDTLTAIIRFMQIGMAQSYNQACQIYHEQLKLEKTAKELRRQINQIKADRQKSIQFMAKEANRRNRKRRQEFEKTAGEYAAAKVREQDAQRDYELNSD